MNTQASAPEAADPGPLELAEKGRRAGKEILLDRRLFMKFTASVPREYLFTRRRSFQISRRRV